MSDPVVKRPVGRPRTQTPQDPPTFSPEVAQDICKRLAGGESLASICRNTEGYPHEWVVRHWVERNAEFGLAYARARESQAEHFADEIVDIADDGTNDFMRRANQRGEDFVAPDREHLERSKIRIATRQWVIERILAGKYGPKPAQVVVNAQTNIVSSDPVEAAQTYQRLISGD